MDLKLTDVASDAAGTPQYARLVELRWNDAAANDETVWGLIAADADDHLRIARLEGLFPQVFDGLAGRGASYSGEWDDLYARWSKARTHMAGALGALGGCALVAKGHAVESYYAVGSRRFFTDLDLVVPDLDALGEVKDRLAHAGYAMGGHLLVFWDERAKQISGVAKFRHVDNVPLYGDIEVQIGIFPMSYETRLRYADVGEGAGTVRRDDMDLRIAAPVQQLYIMLAEFQTRHRVKIRDVFDFDLVLAAAPMIEPDDLIAFTTRQGCERALALLRKGVEQVGADRVSRCLRKLVRDPRVKRIESTTSGIAHLWNNLRRAEQSRLPVVDLLVRALRSRAFTMNHESPYGRLVLRVLDTLPATKLFFWNATYCYATQLDDRNRPFLLIRRSGLLGFESPIGTYLLRTNTLFDDAAARRALDTLCIAPSRRGAPLPRRF